MSAMSSNTGLSGLGLIRANLASGGGTLRRRCAKNSPRVFSEGGGVIALTNIRHLPSLEDSGSTVIRELGRNGAVTAVVVGCPLHQHKKTATR